MCQQCENTFPSSLSHSEKTTKYTTRQITYGALLFALNFHVKVGYVANYATIQSWKTVFCIAEYARFLLQPIITH